MKLEMRCPICNANLIYTGYIGSDVIHACSEKCLEKLFNMIDLYSQLDDSEDYSPLFHIPYKSVFKPRKKKRK